MRTKHLSLAPLCLLLLLAACLGLGLNSCTNDLPELEQLVTPGTDADTPLRPEDYVGRPVSFSGFTVTEVSTDAATRTVTGSSTVPFGKEGEVVTIRMQVNYTSPSGTDLVETYVADYVLSQDGTWKPVSAPKNEPLCWQGVDHTHKFIAYYPALTEQEKMFDGRYNISLPRTWTEDDYRERGRLMQSPQETFDKGSIGVPVSLSLRPLLTRIEVSIDPATGITDATHLTMYTRREGVVREDGTTVPSLGADNVVQEMDLWRSPSPAGTTPGTPSAGTPTDANPVFVGYAIPQTYAPGTLLLKHHTPGLHGARNYTVDVNPNFPDGLVTKGGEVVSFTVAATAPWVHVDKAGGLQAALNAAYPTGDYPTRLKITGELNITDLRHLAWLTNPITSGGQGANITAVDMEGALAAEDAFTDSNVQAFNGYQGSIKNLVLPSSLRTVPELAFTSSTLTSVTLPEGLKKIDAYAFQDCMALKSITLPSSVTTLYVNAFTSSGLTSIELPEGLTDVGLEAFQDCADMQHVALSGNKPITVGARAFEGINPSCHLFLYAPGLDATSPTVQDYLTGTWGSTTWENVHWGYKGSGSKLNPESYEHHLNPVSAVSTD